MKRLALLSSSELQVSSQEFDFGNGAVLVSGGIGGVGQNVVFMAGGKGARKLILASRTGMDSGIAKTVLERMSALSVM